VKRTLKKLHLVFLSLCSRGKQVGMKSCELRGQEVAEEGGSPREQEGGGGT